MVALTLTVLIGTAALTLDGGILQAERRHAQATADAAALAAAIDLFTNYTVNYGTDPDNSARDSAVAVANANYPNGSNLNVVVNIPPTNGSAYGFNGNPFFVGRPGYVEVIIEYGQTRGFSAIFGSGNLTVRARAVARGQWADGATVIALEEGNIPGALTVNGLGRIDILGSNELGSGAQSPTVGPATIVNSSAAAAAVSSPNTTFIWRDPARSEVGSLNIFGSTGSAFEAVINPGVQPFPDPIRLLPPPTGLTVQSTSTAVYTTGSTTLQPGIYQGGIAITGTASVTLSPGIYQMEGGGFTYSSTGGLTGNGILLYNVPSGPTDQINITGQNVNLSPATSGPFDEMLIFQDRNSAVTVNIAPQGQANITGALYAPRAQIIATRSPGNAFVFHQFIGGRVTLTNLSSEPWEIPGHVLKTRILGLVE